MRLLASLSTLCVGSRALAEPGGDGWEEVESSRTRFRFRVPPGFKPASKLLKTHEEEINYKSPEIKGYTVGVAVDPVKIDSLAAFGTPDFVGQRIVDVEKKKDGVIDVQLLKAESLESGGQVFYEVEYTSDTTRGFNHFITRVIVVNQSDTHIRTHHSIRWQRNT